MSTHIINGRAIAENILNSISNRIQKLQSKSQITPKVVTIKIGHDASSELYLKLRNKACKKVGITTSKIEFKSDISQEEVMKTIQTLNQDEKTHGIMIQYPIPNHISQYHLMQAINPNKDVEGLHPYNLGQTLIGNEFLVPCTPLAVIKIIDHENIELKGKNVTIVNHSNIVGKPLAMLCVNRNATVNICHIYTDDIKYYTKKAEILIPATGIPGLITKDHVKKNAIIIDVGISSTPEGIRGDINRSSVDDIAASITPVPGGVGPVTIACSIYNIVQILEARVTK
jgi:methylenetetrahydrofolate dehydrogenase (NADP+)/methenyltetrahydrofolate cyclohydrolase